MGSLVLGHHHAQRLASAALDSAHAARERFVREAQAEASAWMRTEYDIGAWDGSLPVDALWAAAVTYAGSPSADTRARLLRAAREASEGTDRLYVAARRMRDAERAATDAVLVERRARGAVIDARRLSPVRGQAC